ncbi:MAG: diiron oxygenase, partial [Mycobacterium sp.]
RQILEDPDLQPIIKRLMRIHVTEEARHIQFARDGLRRTVPSMPWYRRAYIANLQGVGGPFYRYLFTVPMVYSRVGLDGRETRRVARANPNFQVACRSAFAPLAAFFEEVGLMGRLGRRMWRRAGFL